VLSPPACAAVFDLDGVIVDSRRAVRGAARAALAELGLADPPDAALDRLIGPPARAGFAALLGADPDVPVVTACVEAYHRHYDATYLEATTLVPGMAEALRALTLPLAVATAKALEFTVPLLEALAIADRFRMAAAPALAAEDEPKASILARALASLDAGADACAVMIGDRSYDIEAARACGVRAIGVTWGIGGRAELAGADVLVDVPAQLVALLS